MTSNLVEADPRISWLHEARAEARQQNPLIGYCRRVYFTRTSCKRRCGPKKGTVRKRRTHEVELLQFLPSGRCVAVKDIQTPGLDSLAEEIFRGGGAAAHDAGAVVFGLFQEALIGGMMNSIDFIDLVARLRAAQRAYFCYRTQSNLVKAKKLEAQVDKALKDQLMFKVSEDRQPELMEIPQ